MTKAIISRMASGHCLATFNTDGVVTGTRVVGKTTDNLTDAAKFVATNFPVDQVGIRANNGKTLWVYPVQPTD